MKKSARLCIVLTSLCLLNACQDWSQFTPKDCEEGEVTTKTTNHFTEYFTCENGIWKAFQPECYNKGDIRYKPDDTNNTKCVQQKCSQSYSWDSENAITDSHSCVLGDGEYSQFGECVNGYFSCDEDNTTISTPLELCVNGKMFQFGTCSCSVEKGVCEDAVDGLGWHCEDGTIRSCTVGDGKASCMEQDGQKVCGECLNGSTKCESKVLSVCRSGRWDESGACGEICESGTIECTGSETAIKTCRNGKWESQVCQAESHCSADEGRCIAGKPSCTGGNVCVDNRVYSCEDDGLTFKQKCSGSSVCSNGECVCVEDAVQCSDDGRGVLICKNGEWTEGTRCGDEETCSNGKCLSSAKLKCLSSNNCEKGMMCVQGECKPSPVNEEDKCEQDDDCGKLYKCENSVCTVISDGAEGGKCKNNTTCNPGLKCGNDNTCEAIQVGEKGGKCIDNTTCKHGLKCGNDNTCEAIPAGEKGGICHRDPDHKDPYCDGSLICDNNNICVNDYSEDDKCENDNIIWKGYKYRCGHGRTCQNDDGKINCVDSCTNGCEANCENCSGVCSKGVCYYNDYYNKNDEYIPLCVNSGPSDVDRREHAILLPDDSEGLKLAYCPIGTKCSSNENGESAECVDSFDYDVKLYCNLFNDIYDTHLNFSIYNCESAFVKTENNCTDLTKDWLKQELIKSVEEYHVDIPVILFGDPDITDEDIPEGITCMKDVIKGIVGTTVSNSNKEYFIDALLYPGCYNDKSAAKGCACKEKYEKYLNTKYGNSSVDESDVNAAQNDLLNCYFGEKYPK